ncbi:hypothetical protein PsYK624_102280 [Phanerochaete sordida]|uniref:Uncharacterized protein n=1 Tax=Phanerochaete sordida TaxID=48140 RepID=A0A9P3LG86_9APHY|nr:hypothetical protein PsYK624_102280 [Phanerochaete sordida]
MREPYNTDITGLGVRIAFYLQTTVTMLLMLLQPDDTITVETLWTQMLSGLALLVTTMVSSKQSYFDTVHVQRLIFFSGTPIVHMLPYFFRSDWRELEEHAAPRESLHLRRKALSGLLIPLYILFANLFTLLLSTRGNLDTHPCVASMRFYFSFLPIPSVGHARAADIACVLLQLEVIVPTIINIYVAYHERDPRARALHRLATLLAGLVMHVPSIELSLRQSTPVDGAPWTLGQVLALLATAPLLVQLSFAVGQVTEDVRCCGRRRRRRG